MLHLARLMITKNERKFENMDRAYEIDKEALSVLMENETVCWGEVSRLARDPDGKSYMTVLLGKNQEIGIKEGGEKCVIYADEADTDSDNPYLMSLMGRRIPFIIMGTDEDGGRLLCSRKKAQDQLKAAMLQGLAAGKVYEGELVSFSRYGGYIEVSGVTGHIRNSDFSTDHSDIKEYMRPGDKVEVRCKEVSQEGYIFWEALNKVHRTNPLEYDFEEDTIVMGTVVRIADFKRSSGVFVNLQLGIDALCPVPRELEIEEGSRVSMKIESITKDKDPTKPPKIRGRIVRVI